MKTTKAICSALLSIFGCLGLPKIIQSDNGKEFTSRLLKEWAIQTGIDIRHSLPYRPQSNGRVERTNGIILRTLRKFLIRSNISWSELIPLVQLAINTTPRIRSGASPYELFFLRQTTPPLDYEHANFAIGSSLSTEQAEQTWKILSEMLQNILSREYQANSKHKIRIPVQLHPGQIVSVRQPRLTKLSPPGKLAKVVHSDPLLGTSVIYLDSQAQDNRIHHSFIQPAIPVPKEGEDVGPITNINNNG
jgi:hypothetical protein